MSVSDVNVVKMSGLGSTQRVDILAGVNLDEKYKYVFIRGVVISGVWTVPEGCAGGAVVSLMDKRMKGYQAGLVAELKTYAKERKFQVKFVPNYAMYVEDAKRKPWEVFFKLVKVPIEDSYYPLAVEIAVLVEQSSSIIDHGLRATVLNRCSGDDSGLMLPSIDLEDSIELISNARSYAQQNRKDGGVLNLKEKKKKIKVGDNLIKDNIGSNENEESSDASDL